MTAPLGLDPYSQVWWGNSNFSQEYNDKLCEIARKQKETVVRTKVNGKESKNLLLDPAYQQDLKPLLNMWEEAVSYAFGLTSDQSKSLWLINEVWSHVTTDTKGHYQPHHHGSTFWSGVYYPKAPPGSGGMCYSQPSNVWQGGTESGISSLRAVSGLWAIFPSPLLHWTELNQADVERICFAFNSKTVNDQYIPHIVNF